MAFSILVIEDNLDHIYIAKRILEQDSDPFLFDSTDDPQKGIEKILEGRYDAVLCDYRLPRYSALDILKEIRSRGKDVPFIVSTAAGDEKAAVTLMKEGASDYILKDNSYEDILPMVIKKAIERYVAEREKKRLEEVIKESEKKYRLLVENQTDLVIKLDKDGRYLFVSPSYCEMFGKAEKDLIGAPCPLVVDENNPGGASGEIEKLCQPPHVSYIERYMQTEYGWKWFSWANKAVVGTDEHACEIVCVGRDITDKKKAEDQLQNAYRQLKETQQQLVQSGKMAAMGQLAAGLSHELNQPLTGVKGFAQALFNDLPGDSPAREDVRRIMEQSDRMDKIIQNVRFFARKSAFILADMDITKPIDDAVMLLREQLKLRNIRLNVSFAEGLPPVKGDANQLQQVFINFLTNARDAILKKDPARGGELSIAAVLSDDKKYIRIIFKDTGCGIPREDLESIFNPFFTTKSPDGGIGLGLSIVYRIIENHKGTIEVDSEPGAGTTFTITLPALQPAGVTVA